MRLPFLDRLRRSVPLPKTEAERRTEADRDLARRLRHVFESELAAADVRGLHLYVQGGTVTLYGTARHDLDKDLVTDLVRQLPGVKGVVTHLQLVGNQFQTHEPAAL